MNTIITDFPNIPKLPEWTIDYVLKNKLVIDDGLWLEFGVWHGETITKIASFTSRNVYGFDSFEGLPEVWDIGIPTEIHNIGMFSLNGNAPTLSPNIKLIKGWFDQTIVPFITSNNHPIYMLHIDCDIYSSTNTIFKSLGHKIHNGCIIVFDEICNYPLYKDHEYKAWIEFTEANNIKYEWIGYWYQTAAVKIIDNPSYK